MTKKEALCVEMLARSTELELPWCLLHPAQMGNFKTGWVLIIDDRCWPARSIRTAPIENGKTLLENLEMYR